MDSASIAMRVQRFNVLHINDFNNITLFTDKEGDGHLAAVVKTLFSMLYTFKQGQN